MLNSENRAYFWRVAWWLREAVLKCRSLPYPVRPLAHLCLRLRRLQALSATARLAQVSSIDQIVDNLIDTLYYVQVLAALTLLTFFFTQVCAFIKPKDVLEVECPTLQAELSAVGSDPPSSLPVPFDPPLSSCA